jgi:hypothetical protein
MTEDEAKVAFREAWDAFCQTFDDVERDRLGTLMDSLQPLIATGPSDPRWQAFKLTLPGYQAFWDGFPARALQTLLDNNPGLRGRPVGGG